MKLNTLHKQSQQYLQQLRVYVEQKFGVAIVSLDLRRQKIMDAQTKKVHLTTVTRYLPYVPIYSPKLNLKHIDVYINPLNHRPFLLKQENGDDPVHVELGGNFPIQQIDLLFASIVLNAHLTKEGVYLNPAPFHIH